MGHPGPGDYNPNIIHDTNNSSYKIGKDHRRTFQDKRDNPGPGSYIN